MSGYKVAHISELDERRGTERPRWAPVRSTFGIGAFGVNAWTSQEADQDVIGEHDEVGPRAGRHEELYFVAKGHAVFTVAGDEVDAPEGTFVFVRDPAAKRKAVAKEAETTVLVVGGPRGEAYQPANWERLARALTHWETKDWESAIAELSGLHGDHPDDAAILYNLACAESLAGRRDDAIEHLSRALALDQTFAELAEKDSDFDSIRDDPRFGSAVAGQSGSGGQSA